MEKYKRVFLIVLDSLGIGEAHDAEKFDDLGANTLAHICEKVGGLDVPCMEGMGLGNIGQFQGIHALKKQLAYTARLEEVSNGKDTMTGHWEMMGLHITKPLLIQVSLKNSLIYLKQKQDVNVLEIMQKVELKS